MATTITFANATRDGMLDAITTAIGASGLVRIYTTPKPANADTAIGTATLLGELTFSATVAAAASGTGHVWTANTITQDTSADTTGIALWARVWKSNGTTAVFDCDVATSGAVINLNTTSIVSGGPIQISSFTITLP